MVCFLQWRTLVNELETIAHVSPPIEQFRDDFLY